VSSNYLLTVVHPKQLSNEMELALDSLISDKTLLTKKSQSHYTQYKLTLQNPSQLQTELKSFSDKFQLDVALVDEEFTKKKKLLFIFDMDSTLVGAEVINVLADLHGVGDQTKEITKIAMNGGMSFDESLKIRLALLKGMSRTQLKHVDEKLPLNPGVEEFMKRAHALGHKTAIASGGFNFFADDLKARLKMDYAFSNELEFKDDLLTGNIIGSIVNAEAKEKIVNDLSKQENLTPADVVAVGDGANDLFMLARAHMGVAFHAKETVKAQSKFHINYGGMDNLLYYLGMQE
jgi:phosphoserine phosphatase